MTIALKTIEQNSTCLRLSSFLSLPSTRIRVLHCTLNSISAIFPSFDSDSHKCQQPRLRQSSEQHSIPKLESLIRMRSRLGWVSSATGNKCWPSYRAGHYSSPSFSLSCCSFPFFLPVCLVLSLLSALQCWVSSLVVSSPLSSTCLPLLEPSASAQTPHTFTHSH